VEFDLGQHMRESTENDTGLLAEVQMFWTEPALDIPLLSQVPILWIRRGAAQQGVSTISVPSFTTD